jgi:hypothetical protein
VPETIPPRRYARTTPSYRVSIVLCCLSLFGLVALAGCGGGSGNSHPIVTPPDNTTREINGTVTDVNNAPVVGASLRFGTQTAASTQYGAYIIPNVVVPSGQTSLVSTVVATATVKGVAYSGQNEVEVLSTDPITRDVQIVMSPTNTQGSIIGVVLDANGNRLAGARVFANIGPFAPSDAPDQQFFNNLGSFKTTSRSDGSFTLPSLPPNTISLPQYTVTASLAGRINQTINKVVVRAASSTQVTLTLAAGTGASTLPAPVGLAAQSITVPLSPTRAAGVAGDGSGFLNVMRQIILKKRNLLNHHAAGTQNVTLHRSVTRATPSGSLIESDVFWDYQQLDNLYGYDVVRATSLNPANFVSIATIRDPLADRFADNDSALTPDQIYYYSVARLDTIVFPTGAGGFGDPAQPPVAVQPLGPLSLASPASGSTTTATPTFRWNGVNRANLYKVLVYDAFPTLQTDSDPNGVPAIWNADFNGTSATYAGPTLISGHTYYWAVLAQDAVGSAFSLSPLQTFVAP